MAADHRPARRVPTNVGVLSRTLRPVCLRAVLGDRCDMSPAIPFVSLTPGPDANAVRAAIDRVIARGWFILGPEVEAFEREFAAAAGAAHAIAVGTGTDALALTLRALGIGPGDEVITAPVSAAFSALAIQMAGATPVFADLDPNRLTMDPDATEAAIGSRTRAIMPVHLYGQPA